MNPLMTFATKEVATMVVLNLAWGGYKEYCKWCWKRFYLTNRNTVL